MTGTEWGIVLVVGVLFFASVFLALCETAFTRMHRIRAMALEDEGRKGASRLVELLEKPERTLNTVLFLTLCCHLISASLLGIVFDRVLGGWGIVAGLALEIVFFFVIAEVMPKTYAVQHTDLTALRLSGFLYAITKFPPLRVLSSALIGVANALLPGRGLKEGPFVTEEDLRAMADAAADEESIEREERRLIHSIFEFGDTVVREVMQPRTDMVATEADTPIEDAIEQAIAGGYSRLPVYQESTDDIVGLVYLKDLVRRAREGDGAQPVRTALRVAVFVPEQKRVAELLRDMQTQHFHMAMVVDEHGGTAGIVTLEDLLEEIVGEIADEYDVVTPTAERLPDGSLRVPGRMPIDDLSELLDMELPSTEWDTVAGLVLNLLGHVPVAGEASCLQGWEFRVDRMQGRRVASVRVSRVPDTEASGEREEGDAATSGERAREDAAASGESGAPASSERDREGSAH